MRQRWALAVSALLAAVISALPMTAQAADPAPAGLSGPDIASYQHPGGGAIDWTAVRNSGQRWAFVKATEGTTYLNPYFAGDWRDSAAAGLFHGAYHYARPSTVTGSATAQAQAFATAIGPQQVPGTLPPILDMEETGGLPPASLIAWTSEFLTATQAATGRTPMIYTYPSFWRNAMAGSAAFTGYPLWIASYGVSAPPTLGWANWTFWQYTSAGSIDGIGTPGGTDVSVFNGTSLDLAALATAGTWGPPVSTSTDTGTGQDLSRSPVSSRYVPLPAQRFVDSRTGLGHVTGAVAGAVTVQVPDAVPADATGVVLDVSAVAPKANGWLRVAPTGSVPTTTALNYSTGHSVTGLVVTAADAQRQVTVTTYAGAADLTIDLVGYFTSSQGTGGHWSPVPPTRVVDTRTGVGAPTGQVNRDLTFTLPASVPPGATGIVLDVTAVDPQADGYLRLAPTGSVPTTTALNFEGGAATTGLAITNSSNGQVTISVAGTPTNLVVDLVGYYEGTSTAGSQYVAVTPQRFVDTRSGLAAQGPGTGPLAISMPSSVPRDAVAVLLDVSVVSPTGKGYVRLAAPGTAATTTAVNMVAGRSRTGLVLSGVRDGQVTLAVFGAKTQLVIDLVGYQTADPTLQPNPTPTQTTSPTPSPSAVPPAAVKTGTSPPPTATRSPTPSPSPTR